VAVYLKAAFDSVDGEVLLRSMRRRGIREELMERVGEPYLGYTLQGNRG